MTHFITLHYLALFAPSFALLFGAVVGLPRPALSAAIGFAFFGLTRLPEELFSRQIACDPLALGSLVAVALLTWRSATRRTLLAAFALATVAAGNDLVTLVLASTLAGVCLAPRALLAWAFLAGGICFAITGETELAIVTAHPMAAVVLALGCLGTLPWRWQAAPAALALVVRLTGLWLAAPGSRWLLQ